MNRRPLRTDTEDDILRQQEEFLKSINKVPKPQETPSESRLGKLLYFHRERQ